MGKRVIAVRILTGEILSWDVPLSADSTSTRELSGPGSIVGTIDPVWAGQVADDGAPVLDEWRTALFVEEGGQIRNGGIVIRLHEVGQTALSVECAGYSTYPHGIPFMDRYRPGMNADPFDVVRHLWGYVQSFPDADLGVVVDGDESHGVYLDDPTEVEELFDGKTIRRAARLDDQERNWITNPFFTAQHGVDGWRGYSTGSYHAGADIELGDKAHRGRHSGKITWSGAPAGMEFVGTDVPNPLVGGTYHFRLWVFIPSGSPRVRAALANGSHGPWTHHWNQWVQVEHPYQSGGASDAVGIEADGPTNGAICYIDDARLSWVKLGATKKIIEHPYKLLWWENVDCGEEVDRIFGVMPADYIEDHSWTDESKTTIEHRVRLGWPRVGKKRRDLRFVEGENVIRPVEPDKSGDKFAQNVYGLGKGEGRKMARAHSATRDGRLRRVAVTTDKSAGEAAIKKRVQRELRHRRPGLDLESVEIRDSRNARIASIRPGDDVLIEFTSEWFGHNRLWVRVLSVTEPLDGDTAVLRVQRSDDFNYAPPSVEVRRGL